MRHRGGGFNLIDRLQYAYEGNRLIGVNDNNVPDQNENGFMDNGSFLQAVASDSLSHEYFYDANGNLVKDLNKGIETIGYNFLNLPEMIDMDKGNIYYLYDAAGIKLRQKEFNSRGTLQSETNYIGNFAYEGESSLKFILTDEGRLVPKDSGGFEYEYFIKDHLGNTRLTVQDSSGIAAIKQEDHYYPFGMVMNGLSNPKFELRDKDTKNDYLYNGKEFQDELGLDWYDYGARFYDAQIARFTGIDPLAEKYNYVTPYNYAENSPISNIDLWGLQAYLAIYGTGKIPGEQNQFRREAQRDMDQGLAKTVSSASTAKAFVNELENQTLTNGSIQYLSVFSHSQSEAIIFDNGSESTQTLNKTGSLFSTVPKENQISVADIAKNENIKFDDGALAVFTGCNSGSPYYTPAKDRSTKTNPIAMMFTFETGVTSIGADGQTAPVGNKQERTASYTYYVYQKGDGNQVTRQTISEFLGFKADASQDKTINQYKIERVFNKLNPLTPIQSITITHL